MIYDPTRRAQELRQRIIESMTAQELEQYARERAMHDAKPVIIRKCERCGQDRILSLAKPGTTEVAVCKCGGNPLDEKDLAALAGRDP